VDVGEGLNGFAGLAGYYFNGVPTNIESITGKGDGWVAVTIHYYKQKSIEKQ